MSTITQFPSGNTQYRIEFDYLARTFVVVTLVNSSNPTLNRVLEVGRDYRFLNPTMIEMLVDQSGFDIVRIHRQTGTDLVVDFRNGSVLTASDLTNAELQAIHIAEEGRDQTVDLAKEYADAAESSAGNAKDSEDEARRIAENIKASGKIGYITRRSFEKGFNVTTWNEVLLWEANGEYYRWDGELPKVVPAGSTPDSTGEVKLGAWVSVGDASLRSEIIPRLYFMSGVDPEIFRQSSLSDQDVLQTAIDYATTNGFFVKLNPNIKYKVTTLRVTCDVFGPGFIFRKSDTTEDLIQVNANSVRIVNVTIDGTRTSGSSAANNIMINGRTGVVLDRVVSKASGGHSITIRDTPVGGGNKVTNCLVDGTRSGYGIYLRNVRGEIIKDTEIQSSHSDGLVLSNATFTTSPVIISKVHAHDNGGNGITTQFINNSSTPAADQVLISECKSHNNGQNGIVCQTSHSIVSNNRSYNNGRTTSHQGMLYNGVFITSTGNVSYNNTGVGFDFGDCRSSSSNGDIAHSNGWLGFEINACEEFTLNGFISHGNLKGKSPADLQAEVLVHKGTGGYAFTGLSKGIVVSNGSFKGGGGGQKYAIQIDPNSYDVVVTGNNCNSVGLTDDIFTQSRRVIIANNVTRWDPMNDSRVSASGAVLSIPSAGDIIQINGAADVNNITIQNSGAYVRGRKVMLRADTANTLILEPGGNINISSAKTIRAGKFVTLFSAGDGKWEVLY